MLSEREEVSRKSFEKNRKRDYFEAWLREEGKRMLLEYHLQNMLAGVKPLGVYIFPLIKDWPDSLVRYELYPAIGLDRPAYIFIRNEIYDPRPDFNEVYFVPLFYYRGLQDAHSRRYNIDKQNEELGDKLTNGYDWLLSVYDQYSLWSFNGLPSGLTWETVTRDDRS